MTTASASKTARNLLNHRHADLTRELGSLRSALTVAVVPAELKPYLGKLSTAADETAAQLLQVERDLGLEIDEILDDLRSELAQLTSRVQRMRQSNPSGA